MYISHCLGVREGIQGHISVCIYTQIDIRTYVTDGVQGFML